MPRIFVEQRNLWGRAGSGVEPQRADLWQFSLANVVNGINAYASEVSDLSRVPSVPAYFAASVTLPELRVKSETIRRDSRPYQMPSWDDPLDAIRVVFLLDAASGAKASIIYRVLESWRALVRAGRGSMTSGYETGNKTGAPGKRNIRLGPNYRVDCAFNVALTLLKGSVPRVNSVHVAQDAALSALVASKTASSSYFSARRKAADALKLLSALRLPGVPTSAQSSAASAQSLANSLALPPAETTSIDNDLQVAGDYLLVNAWLGGMKLSELSYAQNGLVTLEATLYAEDIVDQVDDSSTSGMTP